MIEDRTFDADLSARMRTDGAGLASRLDARGRGPAHARRRGLRRRRAARTALAVCTVLLVVAVGVTARSLSRQGAPVDQPSVGSTTPPAPDDATPDGGSQQDEVDVVGTTTPAPPSTAPPVTVAPDPSGVGALPIDWSDAPSDLAGLGRLTTGGGVTYSLFADGPAATQDSETLGALPMTVSRTGDGTVWERRSIVPWATAIGATDDGDVFVAGSTAPARTGVWPVRLARSTDGAATWIEQDVELAGAAEAPTSMPVPIGLLDVPFPGAGPSTSVAIADHRGSWSVSADTVGQVQIVVGATPGTVLAIATVTRPADGRAVPRCGGAQPVDRTFWITYADGVTVELRPDPGAPGGRYGARVVRPGTTEPAGMVRCSVALDVESASRIATMSDTVVLRHEEGRWAQVDDDLPEGSWAIQPMGAGFVAASGALVLTSADGASWQRLELPQNWPPRLGEQAGGTDGRRLIGLDAAAGQVATTLDGGLTWTRVDVRALPVPGGPANPTSIQYAGVTSMPNGFLFRYLAAEGDRFWRVLATSSDGRTWSTMDESAAFWSGMLSPAFAVAGDRIIVTDHQSVATSQDPLVVGYTTRNFVGTPSR